MAGTCSPRRLRQEDKKIVEEKKIGVLAPDKVEAGEALSEVTRIESKSKASSQRGLKPRLTENPQEDSVCLLHTLMCVHVCVYLYVPVCVYDRGSCSCAYAHLCVPVHVYAPVCTYVGEKLCSEYPLLAPREGPRGKLTGLSRHLCLSFLVLQFPHLPSLFVSAHP